MPQETARTLLRLQQQVTQTSQRAAAVDSTTAGLSAQMKSLIQALRPFVNAQTGPGKTQQKTLLVALDNIEATL